MRIGSGLAALMFGGLLALSRAELATHTTGGTRRTESPVTSAAAQSDAEWPGYGGGPDGIRYSPLTQVDRSNVSQLQVAWTYDSGEGPGGTQCQPLVGGGALYAVTPQHNI